MPAIVVVSSALLSSCGYFSGVAATMTLSIASPRMELTKIKNATISAGMYFTTLSRYWSPCFAAVSSVGESDFAPCATALPMTISRLETPDGALERTILPTSSSPKQTGILCFISQKRHRPILPISFDGGFAKSRIERAPFAKKRANSLTTLPTSPNSVHSLGRTRDMAQPSRILRRSNKLDARPHSGDHGVFG